MSAEPSAQATATLSEATNGRLRVVLGAGSHFETLPGIFFLGASRTITDSVVR